MGIWQKISHTDTHSSLNFQFIAIADTDFRLKTNEFCNNFGYDGTVARLICYQITTAAKTITKRTK